MCVCVCGGKGNVLVHTVRAYGGVKVLLHLSLTSELNGDGQLYALVTLPWEEAQYTLNRDLGVPQSWSGYSEEENITFPCQKSPLIPQVSRL